MQQRKRSPKNSGEKYASCRQHAARARQRCIKEKNEQPERSHIEAAGVDEGNRAKEKIHGAKQQTLVNKGRHERGDRDCAQERHRMYAGEEKEETICTRERRNYEVSKGWLEQTRSENRCKSKDETQKEIVGRECRGVQGLSFTGVHNLLCLVLVSKFSSCLSVVVLSSIKHIN